MRFAPASPTSVALYYLTRERLAADGFYWQMAKRPKRNKQRRSSSNQVGRVPHIVAKFISNAIGCKENYYSVFSIGGHLNPFGKTPGAPQPHTSPYHGTTSRYLVFSAKAPPESPAKLQFWSTLTLPYGGTAHVRERTSW